MAAINELTDLETLTYLTRYDTTHGDQEPRVSQQPAPPRFGLRELGATLSLDFRRRFEGRRLDAIALTNRRGEPSQRALTGNFIEVDLPRDSVTPGDPVVVRIGESSGKRTQARREGAPAWA